MGFDEGGTVQTFTANVDGTGQAHLPEAFGANYRLLTAALDFVRAYSQTGRSELLVRRELEAAARYARNLAAQCDDLAERSV